MKKRILLIGNDRFMREAYVDNNYFIMPKNKYVDGLYEAYEVDNISNFNLTSARAISLVDCFSRNYNYDMCLISFGTNELKNVSVDKFEINLQNIINVLICNGIVPIIMEFPVDSNYNTSAYNEVIKNIKSRINLDNKIASDCLKLVNA